MEGRKSLEKSEDVESHFMDPEIMEGIEVENKTMNQGTMPLSEGERGRPNRI